MVLIDYAPLVSIMFYLPVGHHGLLLAAAEVEGAGLVTVLG